MENEHLPVTEFVVNSIWNAYGSFMGKPGLIGKIDAFNEALHREMSKIYTLQPRPVGKSNKPLLTADAYKAERERGLGDLDISAKYRVTSPKQVSKLAEAYNKFEKMALRNEGREPSLLEAGLRRILVV